MEASVLIESKGNSELMQPNQSQDLIKAVIRGEAEIVQNLLKIWGGSQQQEDNDLSSVRNGVGNTILHLAVLYCHHSIVELLMRDGQINSSVKNNLGRTPLHLFHCEKFSDDCNCLDHHKCLESLLCFDSVAHDATLDAQDNDGNTALHFAVQQKCAYCIQSLIRAGASLNIKSNCKDLPFVTPGIFNQYPLTGNYLESQMTKAVYEEVTASHKINEEFDGGSEFRILMDFSSIVPYSQSTIGNNDPQREMEFLETVLSANRSDQKKIFGHPLVSSFVFMKWERVKRIFILSLILHIALATVYSFYILTVYLTNCPYRASNSSNATHQEERICDKGFGSVGYSISLLIVAGILGILESIKMLQNPTLYFTTWNNYFQMIMIVCMFMTVWPVRWSKHGSLFNWQYSASAYGIFHVWATLMINMGRFPKLGVYVEMFGKVLQNFGYLMMAYIFLMLAFSISFCVIFPDYPPFQSIPRAILKVITMMSGEVDYGDFFYGDHTGQETKDFIFKTHSGDLIHPITGHVLYGAFVVLVTIVLTNLLIGLAVDDIKGLQQNAGLTKTRREVGHIAYLESLIFWCRLPNTKFIECLRRSVFLGRLKAEVNLKRSYCNRLFASLMELRCLFRNEDIMKSKSMQSKRKMSDNKNLPKYTFGISQYDCKSPRSFPEDTLQRAVEMINKDHPNNFKKDHDFVFKNQHCRTCQCSNNNT